MSKIDKANITGKFILIGQTPVPEPDLIAWAMWLEENWNNRTVAQTEIGATLISTIFLGLDYSWILGKHDPLLFETMVFVEGRPEDCERCSTWLEAEAQHARVVEMVMKRMESKA